MLVVEVVQVGRLSNSSCVALFGRNYVMPCAVICQTELWSRILLITLRGQRSHDSLMSFLVSHCLLVLFLSAVFIL